MMDKENTSCTNGKQLIRVSDARKALGVSKSIMTALIRQGAIHGILTGSKKQRYVFVTRVSLDNLIHHNSQGIQA